MGARGECMHCSTTTFESAHTRAWAPTCVQMSRLEMDHCVFSVGVNSSVQVRWPRLMSMVQEASGRRPPGMSSPAGVWPLPYWKRGGRREGRQLA